ncbi:MAG: hypothetical protein ABSF32_08435 [Ignavibacteria bacterium]
MILISAEAVAIVKIKAQINLSCLEFSMIAGKRRANNKPLATLRKSVKVTLIPKVLTKLATTVTTTRNNDGITIFLACGPKSISFWIRAFLKMKNVSRINNRRRLRFTNGVASI